METIRIRVLLRGIHCKYQSVPNSHVRTSLTLLRVRKTLGQNTWQAVQQTMLAPSNISSVFTGAVVSVAAAWMYLSSPTLTCKETHHSITCSSNRCNFKNSLDVNMWMHRIRTFLLQYVLLHPVGCSTGPQNTTSNSEIIELLEGKDFVVFQRAWRQDTQSASLGKLQDIVASFSHKRGETRIPSANVVLIGEVHDDRVAHHLQLRILQECAKMCHEQGRRLVLSLEMFELDVQRVLDEYVLQRSIREADFLQDARPWANYYRDYRPLVEFCRENGYRVIAANAPRRYVSLVSRGGDAALQKHISGDDILAKSPLALPPSGIPPLPLPAPSPAYRHKFIETIAMQMQSSPAHSASGDGNAHSAPGGGNGCPYIGFRSEDVAQVKDEMLQAQQLWDHSMAYAISQSLQCMEGETKPPLVVHVCGAFHCAHGLGIPEALPLYAPICKRALEGKDAASGASDFGGKVWLPMDDAVELTKSKPIGSQSNMSSSSAEIAPKVCPPGVTSVVCWPAAVAATKQAAQMGRTPESLGVLADWVIITDELFDERYPTSSSSKMAKK